MGRDKADLLLRGRTLLQRAVDRVREAGGEPLIVGPARPESGTGSCRRIDEEPGAGLEGRRGPLFALHHGLQVCGTRRAVALACDLPLVPARFLRLLVDESERYDAVVPRAAGELQVLCAAYTVACLPAIERHQSGGDRSVHGFLGSIRVRIIDGKELEPFGGEEIFLNVNRPEDLERAASRLLDRKEAGARGD